MSAGVKTSAEPLTNELARREELPIAQAVEIIRQLAHEIAQRHESGRLHLSVAAEMVSYDSDTGRAGLREPPESERAFGGMDCDDEFCPPELQQSRSVSIALNVEAAQHALQAEGLSAVDPRRIDIYQLGTLLCRLMTGQSVNDFLSRPRVAAKVPPDVRELIERALGHDTQRAIRSAAELLLEPFLLLWDGSLPPLKIAELVGTPLDSSPGGEILCRGNTPVQAILSTPNANQLILCDLKNTFRLWDLPTKSIVREFHTESAGDFRGAAISADGKRLATAADINFDVLIWDLENPDNQNPIKKVFVPWKGQEGGAGSGRVVADVAFLKNHDPLFVYLVPDSDERWREAAQWSIADNREIRRTFLGQNLATAPVAIRGGEQLVAVRYQGDPNDLTLRAQLKFDVVFVDSATGTTKAVIPLGKLWAFGGLVVSPDERLATLSLRDAQIVLDCVEHKVIQKVSTSAMRLGEGNQRGMVVGWSPDSRCLAIANPDNSIHVWDARHAQPKSLRLSNTRPSEA